MSKAAIDLLIDSWHQQGICLEPPAVQRDIESTFQDCGRPATEDVLDLYRHLGGFSRDGYCGNNWSLWSLPKIRAENQFNPSQDVWFADYLVNSYLFSLRAEDACTSSVHIQSYYKGEFDTFKVADTLTEFLERLLSDPDTVQVFALPGNVAPKQTRLQRLWPWWKPQA